MKKIKLKNLKKINNILFGINIGLVFAILISMTIFTSCEDPYVEPPRPDCEVNQYGSVTVKNNTGYNVWVDVTWGNIIENYEKLLYNGNSYKYTRISAGSIECWVSFDGIDWSYNNEYLNSCEDLTYTWYLSGKKGVDECPFVLDIGNGQLVEPILGSKD